MSTITDRYSSNKKVAAIAAFAAVVGAANAAHAAPCPDFGANVIYGLGGSSTKPLIAKVAAALAAQPTPITVVYSAPGACFGINGITGNTPITGTVSYWDTSATETTCDLPAAGVPVDFASMGNQATSCPGISALTPDIGDFEGPANVYDLIVPTGSSQTVISSEAAYFAFGFGMTGQAQPWIDETQLFVRDQNSAAQVFISLATGVPVTKFKGINTLNNAGTISKVGAATNPEAALGLVSGEVADAARSTVKILAYQHKGQRCGFLPDSTSTSFDKKNVRNGQYHLWSPLHWFAKIDGTTKLPANPNVATFIGLFTNDAASPQGIDMLNIEIKAGSIPKCGMNVWRDTDLGPMKKNVPAEPCGCYFDFAATGASTCTACTDDTTCPAAAPKCRRNYCEVR